MIAEDDIKHMTVAERLQTMEVLWESLAKADASVSSPAWHGEVLRHRREKVASGKGVFLTLDSVREQLQAAE